MKLTFEKVIDGKRYWITVDMFGIYIESQDMVKNPIAKTITWGEIFKKFIGED